MSEQQAGEMIRAENLSRRFGRIQAVAGVSFTVERGAIVGLLGPNGAGKTTTLRMLSCFLRPTGGKIYIDGQDHHDGEDDLRSRLGYLPENAPLYVDMRVTEYLRFRGRLKGMSRSRLRERMDAVLEACDLTDRRRSVIRTLSKGYRQRVGLADCLLHEPPCLILDEPTIGLDPNQIRQVRTMIRSLATRHTIVLSTHNLSEVEVLCDHVLIMNQGRIVASGTPAGLSGLMQGDERVVVEVAAASDKVRGAVLAVAGVRDVHCVQEGDWCRVSLLGPGEGLTRERLYELAHEQGWRMRRLEAEPQHLEDVFAALTTEHQAKGGGTDA